MVIDSTDAARLNIAKEELHHMMESDVSITKRDQYINKGGALLWHVTINSSLCSATTKCKFARVCQQARCEIISLCCQDLGGS